MAQIDTIFEQVDEQLDADKAQKFWRDNQKWIIGALIVLFASLFAYVSWRDARLKEDRTISDLYIQAQVLEKKGDRAGAEEILQRVMTEHGEHGYALLARLTDAQVLAKAGKRDEAVAHLEVLAAKSSGSPLQGLALLNAAYLTSDNEQQALDFLAKIDEKSSFRPHALELEGLLLAKAGKGQMASARYQQAIQQGADGALRQRLNRRLERLAGAE
ncbi:MAG: tetratricopeptide repeat protein [Magnetococcales bacterium]|nr:tetratricopeptide repeat protein [Magnetococcales bacterium]